MVPGVLVMTTYKFLLIPYRLPRKGSPTQAAVAAPDDQRYLPFGHLPKEYSQVRGMDLLGFRTQRITIP